MSRQFAHESFPYADEGHLVAVAVPFLREGVAAGERVCVVTGHNGMLRDALGGDAEYVDFLDADAFFTWPGATFASYQRFIDEQVNPGARARVLAEAVWSSRTATEVTEWERLEAAVNVAFADAPVHFVCCYDQRRTPAAVQTAAARTHATLWARDGSEPSPHYVPPEHYIRQLEDDLDLPDPPPGATEQPVEGDLGELRDFVHDAAGKAALPHDRADDAMIVINELVTNVLRHSAGEGRLLTWSDERRFVCELRDPTGNRPPPLAGYVDAHPEHTGGSGLALVRQLADLAHVSHDGGESAVRVVFETA